MATVEQKRPDDEQRKGGWVNVNGAPAFVDEDGEIVAGCPGLEGYNIDELDETRDEREAKMDAAEDAGYEPERVKDAREEHAAVDAQSDADVTLVRDGDDIHAFGDDASALQQASQTGDGEAAEFKEEQLPHHVEELQREGHSVDVMDTDAPEEKQSHPEPGAEQPQQQAAQQPKRQVPPVVAERINRHIQSLQQANEALERGRQTDAKYGGEGRYESEEHRRAKVDAAASQREIDQFIELAAKNGIDGRAWLEQAGYEPYAGMSPAGLEYDRDAEASKWWGVRTNNRENLAKAVLGGESIPDAVAQQYPSGMTGHILKTMANHPDFQRTGEVRTNNLHDSYASRLYDELRGMQNRADESGGEAFDLSDEVSPGAIGYHHPEHGTFMIVPPTFDGDKYEFRAVAPQHQHPSDDMPDFDVPEDAGADDDYTDPYADEFPEPAASPYASTQPDLPTTPRLKQAIAEAVGDDPDMQRAFRQVVEEVYQRDTQYLRDRNDAVRQMASQLVGQRGSDLGRYIARLRRVEDPSKIRGFDEVVDMAKRDFPHLFANTSFGATDTEYQVFEELKRGIVPIPERHDDEIIGEALTWMGDMDGGSSAFGDYDYEGGDFDEFDEFAQPPDRYYEKAIRWLGKQPHRLQKFQRLRDRCIRYARQKSLFDDDEETRWITIGGHEEGGKKHAGGRRVEIKKDTGEIVKGPKELTGKKVDEIDKDVAGTPADKRKQQTFFGGPLEIEDKPPVDPKAGKGSQRSLFDDPATFEPMEPVAKDAGKGKSQALFEVDEPATTYDEKRRVQGLAEWIKRNPLRASEIRNQTSNPYEFAVAANMAHLDMATNDWTAVPITGVTDSGPSFALPSDYKAAPTLFTGDAQNPCCGLCGHSIKHVFWLQNDAERQTLPVGSECVTHFMEGQSGQDIAKEFVATANRDLVRQAHDKVQGYINRYAPGASHPRDAWTKMDDPEARKNLWQLSKALGYDQWGSTMADFVAPDAMTIGDRRYDAATNRKVADWVKKHGDRIRDELAKADEYLGGDEAREEGLDQFEEEARDGEIGPQLDQMEPAADTADLTDAMQETTEIEQPDPEVDNDFSHHDTATPDEVLAMPMSSMNPEWFDGKQTAAVPGQHFEVKRGEDGAYAVERVFTDTPHLRSHIYKGHNATAAMNAIWRGGGGFNPDSQALRDIVTEGLAKHQGQQPETSEPQGLSDEILGHVADAQRSNRNVWKHLKEQTGRDIKDWTPEERKQIGEAMERPAQEPAPMSAARARAIEKRQATDAAAEQPSDALREGDTVDIPEVGGRYPFKLHVLKDKGDHYIVSEHEKGSGVRLPKDAVPHYLADLQGKPNWSPDSGHEAIDAVARGEGDFVARGNDAAVYRVGDKIVKVVSPASYHPAMQHNSDMMTTNMEGRRQGEIHQQLRDIEPDLFPEQETIEHDGRVFHVQPALDTDTKMTPEQVAAVGDGVERINAAGFGINDHVQAGIDPSDGKPKIFDTGAAGKMRGDTQDEQTNFGVFAHKHDSDHRIHDPVYRMLRDADLQPTQEEQKEIRKSGEALWRDARNDGMTYQEGQEQAHRQWIQAKRKEAGEAIDRQAEERMFDEDMDYDEARQQAAQEFHEGLKQRIAESNTEQNTEQPSEIDAARKWIDDKLGIAAGDKERWDFAQQYPGTLPEHVDKHFGGAFMPQQQETKRTKADFGASTGTGKTGDLFDVGRNDSPGQELLFDTDGFDEPADKVKNWDLFGSQKQADEPQDASKPWEPGDGVRNDDDGNRLIAQAAESIEKLRKPDVYRVLSNRGDNHRDATELAAWISQKRPDLADEVDDVLNDMREEGELAEPEQEPVEGERWHKGDRVIPTGNTQDVTGQQWPEYEYAEGHRKGEKLTLPPEGYKEAQAEQQRQDWQGQQAGFRRLREAEQAATPPSDEVATVGGVSLDEAVALAVERGHDADDVRQKMIRKPSAWNQAVASWKDAADSERKQTAKDKRDASWTPNDRQQQAIDQIKARRGGIFPKDEDPAKHPVWGASVRAMVNRGYLDRYETDDQVHYTINEATPPTDSVAEAPEAPEGVQRGSEYPSEEKPPQVNPREQQLNRTLKPEAKGRRKQIKDKTGLEPWEINETDYYTIVDPTNTRWAVGYADDEARNELIQAALIHNPDSIPNAVLREIADKSPAAMNELRERNRAGITVPVKSIDTFEEPNAPKGGSDAEKNEAVASALSVIQSNKVTSADQAEAQASLWYQNRDSIRKAYPDRHEFAQDVRAAWEGSQQQEPGDTPNTVTFDPEQHGGYKPLMALSNRIDAGELSVDEFKQEYQRFRQAQPEFLADLNKRFNATQMRNIASNFGNYHARDNKKGENAKFIYDALMRNAFDIGPGMSSSWSMEELRDPDGKIKRLDAHVESIDEDTLQGHIAAQAEKVKKRQEAADAKQKALDNPETLDEYRQFVQQKSYLDLTPEQRKHFDELAADESRTARKQQEQETKGTVQQISENVGGFELSTNFHDKRGHNIFTATPKNRVERDEYNDMNRKAKQLGGWYYKPFRGTPGGFHFPDEESRAKFISLLEGDVDNSEGLTAKKEQRAQTVAEKLRTAADTMESRGNESLAADRRENTARQANMAASARAGAENQIARAHTMRNIADALESGEAKHLDGVSAQTHLSTLDSLLRRARWDKVDHLRKTQYGGSIPYNEQMTLENEPTREEDIDHVKYPYPVVDARKVREAIDAVKGRRGIKWDAATLKRSIGDEDAYVHIDTPAKWESFQAVMAKIKRSNPEGHKDLMDYLNRTSENFKRLHAMGITNEHELRQALREYLPIRGKAKTEDPVRKAERELIGKKLEGFFPTPPSLIDEMLGEADIRPEHSVLEPSAGKGDIIDEIKNRNPDANVKALEYNRTLQPVLEAKGHDVEYGDFLQHRGSYDRIVMNPPFEKRQDIDHVRHAYNLLNPGGRLVAIVSSGSVNPSGSEKKVKEFNEWLVENGADVRQNDAGAFASNDAFRKTGVNTHMIVIDK